ncbi:hypothetical protein NHX12_015268 [Muraenolepis orangiensis]|uniref:RNase H type-1 domain-containing protein n=1 Tax=Muraenolepis orangiensis TaxID=630683 RepID=A0A9Q0I4P8_9TELE|nr:hypothetical protein NHX12_015268 [Muraenolepis orangiensis]
MIKETGNDSLHSNLTWTKESHLAFDTIKHKLQEAPALALPDYSKKFALYVASSTNGKHACAVLTQPTGIGTSPQPIAYYSVAYSEVEMGFAPCYRAMAGVSLMYEKSSALTMGYPVTILCHHSLRNLLNHGKYTLTMPRIRDYYRLFEQEDVTLARCHTVNPAETLPTPDDGEPHNCVEEAEKYSKLRLDLQALPLPEADLEYWTDGSCYRVGETLSAGYAVVRAQGPEFVVEKAEAIPQPCSAQLAELVALTEACNLASGQRVTIYTDSAYAHNVCHLFGAIWKGRGFKKADGSPVQHHAQIVKLLQAMMKPKEIAIAKCAAHKSDSSRVTQGNKTADEAAKYATGADRPGKVLLVTHEVELTEKITLQDLLMMQEEANALDKNLWLARGASQDKTGMWRNHEGLIVAPSDLLETAVEWLKSHLKEKFRCMFEGIAKAGQPTRLNDFYIELLITEGDSGEINKEHEVRLIEKASRKKAKEETPITCEDIVKPLPGQDQPSRTIMTTGVAGIGKTVLTNKFTLDWAEGKANHDIHFIFPFTFRELNLLKGKEFSLVELLHHFFIEIKEAGICRFDQFQVIFILDGLDECRLPLDFQNNLIWTDVTESTSVDVLLTNLIRGNLLPSARIWITTRPAAANQIPAECVGRVTEHQHSCPIDYRGNLGSEILWNSGETGRVCEGLGNRVVVGTIGGHPKVVGDRHASAGCGWKARAGQEDRPGPAVSP